MSSISHSSTFPCKTLSVTQPLTQLPSKPATFPTNSVKIAQKTVGKPWVCSRAGEVIRHRPNFRGRAVNDDEGGPEKEEGSAALVAVAEPEEVEEAKPTEIENLKKALVDSFYGTDRGLRATSETRAEIVELITQLEAKNPTPAPTEALTLLNGKWILAFVPIAGKGYTALSKGRRNITDNRLRKLHHPEFCPVFRALATTPFSTNAKFEVRSPKRVQIKFEEGIIGTPQLTDSIEIPENVELLGQKIDLAPFKGLITSVQETASSVVKTISSQPPVKFSIPNNNAESWLLTTYLDEELRISRGDAGECVCAHQGRELPFDALSNVEYYFS